MFVNNITQLLCIKKKDSDRTLNNQPNMQNVGEISMSYSKYSCEHEDENIALNQFLKEKFKIIQKIHLVNSTV